MPWFMCDYMNLCCFSAQKILSSAFLLTSFVVNIFCHSPLVMECVDCRVLSIQSHVVHGYVGNRAAVLPLQVLSALCQSRIKPGNSMKIL